MWMATTYHIRRMSQASKSLLKTCATCGRQITWRKKWEKNWASITYCSSTCRAQKPKPNSLDTQFESAILSLLKQRQQQQRCGENTDREPIAAKKSTTTTPDHPSRLLTCEDVEAHVLAERQSEPASGSRKGEAGGSEADRVPKTDGMGHEGGESGSGSETGMGMGMGKKGEQRDPKRVRERCRRAARRLASRGEVVIVQEGKVVVDPSFAKGVMELRLP